MKFTKRKDSYPPSPVQVLTVSQQSEVEKTIAKEKSCCCQKQAPSDVAGLRALLRCLAVSTWLRMRKGHMFGSKSLPIIILTIQKIIDTDVCQLEHTWKQVEEH